MSILAIDYGVKRTGLAISYYGLGIEPIGVFATKELLTRIQGIVHNDQVKEVVIGQTDNKIAGDFKLFLRYLGKIKGLKINFIDETNTSLYANEERIQSSGKNKRNKAIDDVSACLILEKYLERKI